VSGDFDGCDEVMEHPTFCLEDFDNCDEVVEDRWQLSSSIMRFVPTTEHAPKRH
jgi:hypothetical protein